MSIKFTARALKDLKSVPRQDQSALMAKLTTYGETGQGDVKKLVGSNVYRLRHGHWRALFEISGGTLVIRVLHRREAYR